MSDAIWTGFFFSEIPPATGELHCTHKYFGEQSNETVQKIRHLIELAWRWCDPMRPGFWCFDRLDVFDEGAIVLRGEMDDPLDFLRAEFATIYKDDHPYNMHVTVRNERRGLKNAIKVPLFLSPVEYRLMRGNAKLYTWNFRE